MDNKKKIRLVILFILGIILFLSFLRISPLINEDSNLKENNIIFVGGMSTNEGLFLVNPNGERIGSTTSEIYQGDDGK